MSINKTNVPIGIKMGAINQCIVPVVKINAYFEFISQTGVDDIIEYVARLKDRRWTKEIFEWRLRADKRHRKILQ